MTFSIQYFKGLSQVYKTLHTALFCLDFTFTLRESIRGRRISWQLQLRSADTLFSTKCRADVKIGCLKCHELILSKVTVHFCMWNCLSVYVFVYQSVRLVMSADWGMLWELRQLSVAVIMKDSILSAWMLAFVTQSGGYSLTAHQYDIHDGHHYHCSCPDLSSGKLFIYPFQYPWAPVHHLY